MSLPTPGPNSLKTDSTKELTSAIAKACMERQGEDIRILDMEGLVTYADYLVIVDGKSTPHVQALLDSIEKAVQGRWRPTYVNRSPDQSWMILDFVDVVVHIFLKEVRAQYQLEELWSDAKDGWASIGLEGINPSEGNG